MTKKERELAKRREEYPIVKANALARSRSMLTFTELRLVNYVCTLIKPAEDGKPPQLEYVIDLKDYCKVCGLDMDGNKVFEELKKTFDHLRSICVWIPTYDEDIGDCVVQTSWFSRTKLNKRSMKVELDENLIPFLFYLREGYTQFQLVDTLEMKSSYSIRIFEILKSYAFQGHIQLDLDELKEQLMIDKVKSYKTFPDFRRRVIEPAMREINKFTCLAVSWEPVKSGNKVVALDFTIEQKDALGRSKAHLATIQAIGEIDKPVKRGRGRPKKKPDQTEGQLKMEM